MTAYHSTMRGMLVIATLLLVTPAAAQTAGREPVAGTVSGGGRTLIDAQYRVTSAGVLHYWRAFGADGGRAMLKVFRPEGERLVLVGASPLEELPEGATAIFHCEIPVAPNDLIGCYCPDTHCVDRFADGDAMTIAGDVGTHRLAEFTSETGTPAIAAGTTRAFDIPSRASRDLVVPVVARSPGLGGTVWRTALELFNTAGQPTQVALFFNRSEEDNTQPAGAAQVVLPARGTIVLEDLLRDAFNLEEGAGSLDLVAAAPVLAHVRIANLGSDSGTYGQLVPALPAQWAIGDDNAPGTNPNLDTSYLFEVVDDDFFRTNIGFANVTGVELRLDVTAMVGNSVAGTPLTVVVPPFSHRQLNRVREVLEVPHWRRGVRINLAVVAGGGGRFLAYASRVDNASGDAVLLVGDHEQALDDAATATSGESAATSFDPLAMRNAPRRGRESTTPAAAQR